MLKGPFGGIVLMDLSTKVIMIRALYMRKKVRPNYMYVFRPVSSDFFRGNHKHELVRVKSLPCQVSLFLVL